MLLFSKEKKAGAGVQNPGLNTREQLGQNLTKKPHQQTIQPKRLNRMPTECPIMFAFNQKGQIQPVYCGLWSCSRCAKSNARLWALRVRIHIEGAQVPAWFWTLTLGPSYRTSGAAYKALPKLWDNLRKIVQRDVKNFQYVAFVEGQPRRAHMPHFHIVTTVKSPGRLKDLAVRSGFGFQAKEKRIDGPQAASYVAKYASKQNPATPRGFRRVRASRGWAKLPPFKGHELIVKSRTETLSEYIIRVADVTGVSPDDLFERWQVAQEWED